MGGAIGVYGWELRKLVSQKRTYLGLGAAALVPLLFTIALALQKGQPNDVALGRYVRESGLAIPLVLLLFGSIWLFPLITALVAGDIIASEHHNGTLKTVFTRSLDRGQIFAGKVLTAFTYAIAALLVMGTTAVIAGTIKSGFNPLVTLSGTKVSALKALGLVGASFAVYLLPLFAIACFGLFLSALTRNSAAAVVGTLMFALLMQLIGILPGLGGLQPYLLTTQFQAWQGFLRVPVDWAPVIRAAWLTAAYALRFAGQLREAMAARGIGRIRVAALLGKSSHSVIAQWLSGHTLPRVEEAGRLAAMAPDIFDWHQQARIVGCLEHVLQPPWLVCLRIGLARRHEAEAQAKRVVGIGIGGEIGPSARLAPQPARAVAL